MLRTDDLIKNLKKEGIERKSKGGAQSKFDSREPNLNKPFIANEEIAKLTGISLSQVKKDQIHKLYLAKNWSCL